MSIITISRGSYGRGKAVAEMVAERLGYSCIGRDVVLEASEQFSNPEVRLIRNIRNAPSILERSPHAKEQYVSFIQSALLKNFQRDNVVYHGLAGHFFLRGISHVLKARIIADMEVRARVEMEREKITREEAIQILERDDEERRKWAKYLYGIDTWDASVYDLVIQINSLSIEDAVDIICNTVKLPQFQTTPESQKTLDDLALAAQVKASLVLSSVAGVDVSAEDGVVYVTSKRADVRRDDLVRDVERIAKAVGGVREVKVIALPGMVVE